MKAPTALILLSCLSVAAFAQLPGDASAPVVSPLPVGISAGLRVEDMRRDLSGAGPGAGLNMSRLVVIGQFPILQGTDAWLEGGWHEPELAGAGSSGGFTWGAGLVLRPWRFDRNAAPQIESRQWVAPRLEAGLRGGAAPTRGADGDTEWTLLEARAGLEWMGLYRGTHRGPLDATALHVTAGVLANQLQAERSGIDADQRRDLGIFARATYFFGSQVFVGLEGDWMGTSDRRFALVVGQKF